MSVSEALPSSLNFVPDDAAAVLSAMARADTPQALLASYGVFNAPLQDQQARVLFSILKSACEAGHHLWPNRIRDLVRGKDVLDSGCGTSLYGAVFRAIGARSYLGHDPFMNMNAAAFRNRLGPGAVKTPVTLNIVRETIPDIEYVRAPVLDETERFDICVMHTVTEHLMDIEKSFADIARALRPGGQLWYLHDNFYSWSGHHLLPRSVNKYTPGDAEQEKYVDWRHVDFDPPPGHPFVTNLNRIRLDDLRAVTEKFFAIDQWDYVPDKRAVMSRLTPAIQDRLSKFRREELLTKHAICLARKR